LPLDGASSTKGSDVSRRQHPPGELVIYFVQIKRNPGRQASKRLEVLGSAFALVWGTLAASGARAQSPLRAAVAAAATHRLRRAGGTLCTAGMQRRMSR